MRAEDMKEWIWEATRKNYPVIRIWELVVRLVHLTFRGGTLPEEIAWSATVLIPKGNG